MTGTVVAPSEWLDADEAAEMLRLTRKSLYSAAARGQVPVHRIGRRVRFHRGELDALLLGGRSRGPPP